MARLELGMPLLETFVAQEQIVLSEEREKYTQKRSLEFAEPVNFDLVGGIDMNPSLMEIDIFSAGELIWHASGHCRYKIICYRKKR